VIKELSAYQIIGDDTGAFNRSDIAKKAGNSGGEESNSLTTDFPKWEHFARFSAEAMQPYAGNIENI